MAGNPNWNSAVLALHLDGENNATVFPDVSPSGKTITPFGNVKISTAASRFGGASAAFDGAGDYLQLADHADWHFATGIFSVAFWAKKTVASGYYAIMAQVSGSGSSYNGLQFFLKSSGFSITAYNGNTGVTRNATVTPDTEWHHYEICQDATNLYMFYDGNLVATHPTVVFGNAANPLRIGVDWDAASSPFNGYIDDLIIYNGAAEYTQSFPLPINPFAEGLPAFSIAGLIIEQSAIAKWRIIASSIDGALDHVINVAGSSYTIDTDDNNPKFLTLVPFVDGVWTAGMVVNAGYIVAASDPTATPHLWQCTTPGTTGGTEPVWNLSATTSDNTVVWTYIGPLVQPQTHGPLIPA